MLLLFFRMGDEEKLLAGQFGDEYLAYNREVKRFIPFPY